MTKSVSTSASKNHNHAAVAAHATKVSAEVSPSATPVATPPVTPPGDLPPASGIAPAPADWTPRPSTGHGLRGLRPKGAQISGAVSAANELSSSPTYVEDFGTRAPSASGVAFVVTNAAKWRTAWNAAKKAYEYASEQRAAWENDALAQMDALKPAFQYAKARDSSITEKYSATAKFMGEGSAIASRAASSRKASAKKTAAAEAPAPATEAASAEPAPAPAPAPAK